LVFDIKQEKIQWEKNLNLLYYDFHWYLKNPWGYSKLPYIYLNLKHKFHLNLWEDLHKFGCHYSNLQCTCFVKKKLLIPSLLSWIFNTRGIIESCGWCYKNFLKAYFKALLKVWFFILKKKGHNEKKIWIYFITTFTDIPKIPHIYSYLKD
jgi:hypothetical protein